jgi:hypothetical protein
MRHPRQLAKYTLTYLGTAGLTVLLASAILLILLVDNYNDTRRINVPLASLTFTTYTLAQALLASAVASYTATRTHNETPPIPELPQAKTVALIPAYNEEGKIGKVIEKAKKHVDLVIVVDDGSTDNTAQEAQKAGAIVIRHPQNMGKGTAVKTLIKAALKTNAQYAVLIDADLQHDPDDIPKLLEPLTQGKAEHAIANRFPQTKMPLIRLIGYKLLATLHALLIKPLPDPFNGYRAFTHKALHQLDRDYDPSYGIETEINHALRNIPTTNVPSKIHYTTHTSKANFLLQGLNLAWTIAWTWITHNPTKTLIVAATLYTASALLTAHVAVLFNLSRYIRLTYTALALTLPTIATTLTAASTVALLTNIKQPFPTNS